jgi:hypothetical protein
VAAKLQLNPMNLYSTSSIRNPTFSDLEVFALIEISQILPLAIKHGLNNSPMIFPFKCPFGGFHKLVPKWLVYDGNS